MGGRPICGEVTVAPLTALYTLRLLHFELRCQGGGEEGPLPVQSSCPTVAH
jgi:hypothetical protein